MMDIAPALTSTLLEVAQRYGSPTYVYDFRVVRDRCRRLVAAFSCSKETDTPAAVLLYAMKANSNPHVLKQIMASGFGVDCVSIGEVKLALHLISTLSRTETLPRLRILYTNNNVSTEEFAAAVQLAADNPDRIWINCDSIQKISELPRGAQCFIRVNGPVGGGHHSHVITCGPDSKFGVPHELLGDAIAAAERAGVQIIGLHQHIGSGVLDPTKFAAAIDVLAGVLQSHASALPHVQYVNFGGGIGVPYRPSHSPMDIGVLGAMVREKMDALRRSVHRPGLTLVLEPGRYPVAECGYLVSYVNTVKETPYERTFLGVDTGFNHLVRPTMYGSYHHISNLTGDARARTSGILKKEAYLVAGNICESGDIFTRGSVDDMIAAFAEVGRTPSHLPTGDEIEANMAVPRALSHADVGDVIVFHTTGAYGYSMASEYNTRGKPAEVAIDTVDGSEALCISLIRRRKDADELVADILKECEA
jgi:diaminopimelate decarboxylase